MIKFIKSIYIESDTLNSPIVKNIFENFDNRKIYIGKFTPENFNVRDRTNILWIKNYSGRFIKPCPGTKEMRCCNYIILNQMVNCPFNCTYCYLQFYLNEPYICIYANIDKMIYELKNYLDNKQYVRIGTGEFTDSLVFDSITGFSKITVPFFKDYSKNIIELKTKSIEIENLLEINHSGNVVVSWSLNPDIIIKTEEKGTPVLSERLEAARKCQDNGYLIGFHFDPIIYFKSWESHYENVVKEVFRYINPGNIFCISLGTFRYLSPLKEKIIEKFPGSRIIYEEQHPGLDGKMRYFVDLRIEIYKKMIKWINEYGGDVFVYLCMESEKVWQKVFGFYPESDSKLNKMFFKRHFN